MAMTATATGAQAYEYLKQLAPPLGTTGAVPMTSVRSYVGTHDDNRLFHGEGVLISEMGFRYEGAFLHGVMEGRGRIVWSSGVTYEGSFSRNAPHGYGIFTWPKGELSYLGEVEHGMPHGKGVLSATEETYTGSWFCGKRQGRGYQKYTTSSFYDGHWKEDKRHGSGKMVYPNGDVYSGMWKDGKRHGFGTMGWNAGTKHFAELYMGEWCDGVPHGLGRSSYVHYLDPSTAPPFDENPSEFAHPVHSVVNIYWGSYACGKRHGFGVFFYANGATYEGEWCNGEKEGRGRYTTDVGISHYGSFRGNKMVKLLKQVPTSSTPLPTIALSDLVGVVHSSIEEVNSSMRLLLLRYNNTLKNLLNTYSGICKDIMFITTPSNWWRDRVPGHICIPQYLRLLNDAHIINGHVSIRDAIDCVVATVRKEDEEEQAKLGLPWSGRLQTLCSAVLKLEGHLNYRQFVESLVRLSTIVYVKPNSPELTRCFAALVEGPLASNHLVEEPLFPISRLHGPVLLVPHVRKMLEELFVRLIAGSTQEQCDTSDALHLREFILFFRATFDEAGISLTEALNHLFPFDRFETPGVAPSGVCQPRNALEFTIYKKSCGLHGEFAAALVACERRLVFAEFVEAVLGAVQLLGATTVEAMQKKLHDILSAHSGGKCLTAN